MKKLIIAIVLIMATLAWSAGTYTTDDLVARDDITAGDDITAEGTVQGAILTDGTLSITDGNIITSAPYIGAIPGADAEWYFFHESGSGDANGVWVYGYPTGESLSYGLFKIISGPKFQITSDTGEIDYDNEHLRTAGWMQAEHFYSTDDARVDDDANVGDDLWVGGRSLIGGITAPELTTATDALIYWKMDDALATTAVLDASGNNKHGTANENTDDASVAGKIETALEFGADAGELSDITLTLDADTEVTSEFTIALWLKKSSIVGDHLFVDVLPTNTSYRLWISDSENYEIGCGIVHTDDSYSTGYNDYVLSDDVWHLIIFTYDKNASTNEKMKLYIDGSYRESWYTYTERGTKDVKTQIDETLTVGNTGLHGPLDNFALFARAFTESECDDVWAGGTGIAFSETFSADSINVFGTDNDLIASHITNSQDNLWIQGVLEVGIDAYIQGNLSVDGDITDADNITASATITGEQVTSTDDLTMQGHLFTLGDDTATDIVMSFLGSAHDATITFDESANEFDYGSSLITTTGLGTFGNLDVDTLNLNGNVITDSGGTISFDNENLSTSGTLGAGAITGTSFVIGANTLDTNEWAYLDGQDQAVTMVGDPNFASVTILDTSGAGSLDMYGFGTDKTARGGVVTWRVDESTIGGYTYTNTSNQFVFDNTAQATQAQSGVAYVDFDDGTIQSDGRLLMGFEIIAADDTTPDISGGMVFITSANTGATEITALDSVVVGQVVYLIGGSDTNASTITDGGNFRLSANWTAGLYDTLTLVAYSGTYFAEIARSDN